MLELSLLLALVLASGGADSVRGGPDCSTLRASPVTVGDAIALQAGSAGIERLIEEAVGSWRSCPNYGGDFPRLLSFPPAGAGPGPVEAALATSLLEVRVVRRNSGDHHCGTFRGRTITLFASARNSAGEVRSCGSLALNLAHELGHALGLGDSLDDPVCESTIMAELSPRNIHRRAVSDTECALAGRRWLTYAEWRPRAPRVVPDAPAPAFAAPVFHSERVRIEL